MDLGLDREQESLRDAVRELFRRAGGPDRLDEAARTELGWSRDVWQALADTGILGLTVPESHEGVGAGPVEVGVTMTEIGRALAPEPVLEAALVPAHIIAQSGDDSLRRTYLPGIAAGHMTGAVAHDERGDRWPVRAVSTIARAAGDGFVLHGAKPLVRHGDCADFVIVSARLDGDVELFLVDSDARGLAIAAYRSPDRRRGAHLTFENVSATRLHIDRPQDALLRAELLEQVAICSEAVGAMEEILRITADYLTSRKQFGAALSTFQALAHRVADLYVLVELATSMTLYATAVLEDGEDGALIASRAKLQVSRAARVLGHEGIHLHGGIGVTEEYVIGHYAARLMVIENQLGGALEHLEVLAEAVDDHDSVILG
jgi:alkylation response protein AidB-like acyl-CoA dehydrogenase